MASPTSAVRYLVEHHDLSESEIVARLLELGVKTSQPTINRIKRGTAKKIDYAVGTGLLRLHKTLSRSAQ
jgi:arginine repressor